MNSNRDSHNTHDLSADERKVILAWASVPAPGEERIKDFAPPGLTLNRHRSHWRWVYQAAAALLLFTAGYFAGAAGGNAEVETRLTTADLTPARTETPAPEPITHSNHPAIPSIADATGPQHENCPAPQIYLGGDGHFRIDTTLCKTGSRATWVINPKLELASAPNSKAEESQ